MFENCLGIVFFFFRLSRTYGRVGNLIKYLLHITITFLTSRTKFLVLSIKVGVSLTLIIQCIARIYPYKMKQTCWLYKSWKEIFSESWMEVFHCQWSSSMTVKYFYPTITEDQWSFTVCVSVADILYYSGRMSHSMLLKYRYK